MVTGMGIVCPLGIGIEEFWNNLSQGKVGIQKCSKIDISSLRTKYAAQVADKYVFDVGLLDRLSSVYDSRDWHRLTEEKLDGMHKYALSAAEEAVVSSGLDFSRVDPYRKGISFGTCMGGHNNGERFLEEWLNIGFENADINLLFAYPLHAIGDLIGQLYDLRGPKNLISTACAAGSNAIGHAADLIRSGSTDVMIAGGSDPLSRLTMAGFNSLTALDDQPAGPYSRSAGITLGEGAAFLVLEEYEAAVNRGARIWAEIASYALTADAYHQTAPDLAGAGAAKAMVIAIKKAGLKPADIGYVNGHGTGTQANDSAELKAIKKIFEPCLNDLHVSSTKGATGHCLGATGVMEAISIIYAINEGVIPPTVNVRKAPPVPGINITPNEKVNKEVNAGLSNSFGFGGNNCALVISKPGFAPIRKSRSPKKIVVSGVGCVGPAGADFASFSKNIRTGKNFTQIIKDFDTSTFKCKAVGKCAPVEWRRYIDPSLIRRLDPVTKMAMASAKQALDDANLKITTANCDRVGAIYASGSGPFTTVETLTRTYLTEGMDKVNPSLFPNSVMNAAPGNLCINYRLKGPTTTLVMGAVSTSAAFAYAYDLLLSGDADSFVVVGADECSKTMIAGNEKLKTLGVSEIRPFDKAAGGAILAEGGTAFILESEENALKRGAKIYCEVMGYGHTSDNYSLMRVSPLGEEWAESFRIALANAGINASDIDLFSSAAFGSYTYDVAEAFAIRNAIGEHTPIVCVQSMIGHPTGVSGGFGILNAIDAMNTSELMPILGLTDPRIPDLDYVMHTKRQASINTALVSSFSYGGNFVSIVLKKPRVSA